MDLGNRAKNTKLSLFSFVFILYHINIIKQALYRNQLKSYRHKQIELLKFIYRESLNSIRAVLNGFLIAKNFGNYIYYIVSNHINEHLMRCVCS